MAISPILHPQHHTQGSHTSSQPKGVSFEVQKSTTLTASPATENTSLYALAQDLRSGLSDEQLAKRFAELSISQQLGLSPTPSGMTQAISAVLESDTAFMGRLKEQLLKLSGT